MTGKPAVQQVEMEQHLLPSGSQLQPALVVPQHKSFIGVSIQQSGKFMASITVCGQSLQLVLCDSAEQAVKAHDLTALALFGPDAATNVPSEYYSSQEVEETRQLLLREQQQSQSTLCCSAGSVTTVGTAAAAGTVAAGQGAARALGSAKATSVCIAADAQAVVQPAVGSKRAHQLSSHSESAAAAAPAAADSRCLQEQPLEQLEQARNPSCKRPKLAPGADLPESTDGTANPSTAQGLHQQRQQKQSALADTHTAAGIIHHQQQQAGLNHQAPAAAAAAETGAARSRLHLQQGSRGSTASLLPEPSGSTPAKLHQERLAGMRPAAVESCADVGQQNMHAAYAAAFQQQQQGIVGLGTSQDPGMLNGLLCLIDAAASLTAEEQAVLLPAHPRSSNLIGTSAAQQQQQQHEEACHAEEERQASGMHGQQHALTARVPASNAWPGRAEQGRLQQVPASSQQPSASQRPVQPAVQEQQTFPPHPTQQQQPAGRLAGEVDAMQFLQTDAGKKAMQRLTQQFQQQHQVRDWQGFLQSTSAQQSLLSLQQLYNNQTAVQQQQHQQLLTLQTAHCQLPGSCLPPAAPSLPGQQQQHQQMLHRLPYPLPAGASAAAAAAVPAGQQLGPPQWQQVQQVRLGTPGQLSSNTTRLQVALSAGTNAHPAAAARLFQRIQQQTEQAAAAAAPLKPRRSEEGTAGSNLLSRNSSNRSDRSTYRFNRSPSPAADDTSAAAAAAGGAAAAAAAAGDLPSRARSVSADSGRGTAAAAGVDALAGMYDSTGLYADDAYDQYAGAAAATGDEYVEGYEPYGNDAAAALDMLLGGGQGKRHSARAKRPTERMQEMQQQLREQHKQRNPRLQQEEQQQIGEQQLLQDFWAAFGRAGVPMQFASQQQYHQEQYEQEQDKQAPVQQYQQEQQYGQYEQPRVQRQQQQKKKRINLAWKPAGKAGAAAAGATGSAAATTAASGTAADDASAAAAEGGELPAPVMKVTGPGCVSHAQNPTGQMGVRMRKNRYEAFIAVPPFRYLYLGQHTTAADAVRTRDTAMLAIYGAEAAAAHGAAWLSPGAAENIEAGDVAAVAAKLEKKEQVAGVMKQHSTYRVRLQAGTAAAAAAGGGEEEQ